jgi:hypothetical protein
MTDKELAAIAVALGRDPWDILADVPQSVIDRHLEMMNMGWKWVSDTTAVQTTPKVPSRTWIQTSEDNGWIHGYMGAKAYGWGVEEAMHYIGEYESAAIEDALDKAGWGKCHPGFVPKVSEDGLTDSRTWDQLSPTEQMMSNVACRAMDGDTPWDARYRGGGAVMVLRERTTKNGREIEVDIKLGESTCTVWSHVVYLSSFSLAERAQAFEAMRDDKVFGVSVYTLVFG